MKRKIIIIDKNLSNIWTALVLPFLSALFYTSILHYINLGIDETLKFSINRRTLNIINKKIKSIDDQKLIAIKEIELEDAKIEYREKKQQNNLIEELQLKIAMYEEEIESNRISTAQNIDGLKNSLRQQDENYVKEIANYENIIKNIRQEKEEALELIQQIASDNESVKCTVQSNDSDTTALKADIKKKDQKISDLTKQITLHESKSKPKRLIYKFTNGAELYEQSDDDRLLYIDRNNSRVYDEDDFDNLKNDYNFSKFYE